MILQKIVWNQQSVEKPELYYKLKNGIKSDSGILLNAGGEADFLTYMNIFSAEKWRKYTGIQSVCVSVNFKGKIKVVIYALSCKNKKVCSKIIMQFPMESKGEDSVNTPIFALPESGVVGVSIIAEEDTALYAASYMTDEEREKKEVKIGIGICTFKREKYVERNMKVLKENLLNNENALSYGHLSVCISDNGGTLVREKIEDEHIRIVKNKNLGGVGGFTRTMFEHMRDDSITHVLLMDDDAVISPEAIERTYTLLTLLKEKYRMAVIGGSLLREDLPTLQYECGACWNDGDIVANNHNFDMTQLKNVVINEQIQKAEYTGWWYSCIPVPFIKEMHYPLPFFIHRDDIEYGLRANGQFIFLNGITIWHEAFENKLPGFLEYYDVRNLAITNAIHNPQFAAKDFKKMLFVQVSSNIGKYRYKYVDLNLKGAVDFLRGFKWFYNADTLCVHDGLKKYNYQSMPAEEFIGHNGIKPEDLDPCGRPEAEPPCKLKRILIMLSMNGHFLPAYKNRATKVARPNPNIYDLFRWNEVVYADAAGNAICVKRSRIELLKAYIKMLKVFRLIDLHYDKVCEEYRKNHSKLESKDFWSNYLELKEAQNKEM